MGIATSVLILCATIFLGGMMFAALGFWRQMDPGKRRIADLLAMVVVLLGIVAMAWMFAQAIDYSVSIAEQRRGIAEWRRY